VKWMIEFTTDLFNSTEPKPHFINERCFGEDAIAWVVERSQDSTFKFGEPFQEDWGWATLARKNGETFLVGIGIMDDTIGVVPARWLLMIDKTRRFLVFGSKRSPNLDLLADEVQEKLTKESSITQIERYWETQ